MVRKRYLYDCLTVDGVFGVLTQFELLNLVDQRSTGNSQVFSGMRSITVVAFESVLNVLFLYLLQRQTIKAISAGTPPSLKFDRQMLHS